jgi:hypothetical protein
MKQSIENVAHREWAELESLVQAEMKIPAELLTECCTSFFMLGAISNCSEVPPMVGYEDVMAMKGVYAERIERLYAAVPKVPQVSVMLICNAFSALDMVLRDDTSSDEHAIDLLLAASLFRGLAWGLFSQSKSPEETMKLAKTELAKISAAASHKEDRRMKSDVFLWLDTNRMRFKSMDETAQAITKQQPIVFRTARVWVGEWKKLRSASKP